MNELRIFENPEFGEVRTAIIDEKVYFAGVDIARALGIAIREMQYHVTASTS